MVDSPVPMTRETSAAFKKRRDRKNLWLQIAIGNNTNFGTFPHRPWAASLPLCAGDWGAGQGHAPGAIWMAAGRAE